MFKSKSNGDIERLAKKFVNVKKTNSDRIKYLKQLIGKDSVSACCILIIFTSLQLLYCMIIKPVILVAFYPP